MKFDIDYLKNDISKEELLQIIIKLHYIVISQNFAIESMLKSGDEMAEGYEVELNRPMRELIDAYRESKDGLKEIDKIFGE